MENWIRKKNTKKHEKDTRKKRHLPKNAHKMIVCVQIYGIRLTEIQASNGIAYRTVQTHVINSTLKCLLPWNWTKYPHGTSKLSQPLTFEVLKFICRERSRQPTNLETFPFFEYSWIVAANTQLDANYLHSICTSHDGVCALRSNKTELVKQCGWCRCQTCCKDCETVTNWHDFIKRRRYTYLLASARQLI